jgi:stress response protein YsnF
MAPLDIETALDWRGRTVVDRDGDKIGTFDELYLDDDDRPAWGAVTTGLFGMRQTFVPLSEAQPDGDVLRVPFGKDMVKDAPNVDPDTQLDPEEEELLYRHYGLGGGGTGGGAQARDDAAAGEDAVARDDAAAREDMVARDEAPIREDAVAAREDAVAGRDDADDDAIAREDAAPAAGRAGEGEGGEMIRSEEEVQVGTRRRVSGKARLKKYVVTEHVQKVVPVQREEVRVEFDPADGEAADGAPVEQGRGPAPGTADPAADDAPVERRPADG